MARIMIDARFYGTEHTGLGRYTQNIIDRILREKSKNEYIVLVNSRYLNLKHHNNTKLVECNIKHYSLMEQLVLPYLILKHKVDKLYTLHFNAPILAPTNIIVTIHDLIKTHFSDISTSTHGRFMFRVKRIGYQLVMMIVIAKAQKIIVPTHAVKNDILTVYPNTNPRKIFPIYEAVDDFMLKIEQDKHESKTNKIKLLYVGNSYPHKNILGLLQAFTILAKTGNYHLTLLTKETPYLVKLLKIMDHDTLSRVSRVEIVSDLALRNYYAESDVLITPSFMEGFGLPALEALAQGTRVVASDIPVYREVYKDNVTYCNPFDPISIKEAVEEALEKPRKQFIYDRSWDDVTRDVIKALL